jgi:hypothetical protein
MLRERNARLSRQQCDEVLKQNVKLFVQKDLQLPSRHRVWVGARPLPRGTPPHIFLLNAGDAYRVLPRTYTGRQEGLSSFFRSLG